MHGNFLSSDQYPAPAIPPQPPPAILIAPFNGELNQRPAAQLAASTASVLLRPFATEDAPHLYEAARESMDPLCEWMTWCRPEYSLQDSERFIVEAAEDWAKGERYSFAIIDTSDGTFLGSAGINHVNRTHGFANLGYWVRNSKTRRGVATAATVQIARFALRQLGLSRIELLIPADNLASQRVAQKAGAKFEGLLRNRLMLRAKSHDAVLYSLLLKDLEPPR